MVSEPCGHIGFIVQGHLKVTYSCDGFLEKNVDKPPDEAGDLLKASSLTILQQIGTTIAEELAEANAPGKKKAKTVSSGFRSSLASLVQKLNEADPHFIRCVKPNPEKVPDKFASTLVMEQLTCSGVFEAVRIRQSGFAARIPFGDFLGRYKIVVPKAKHKAIFTGSEVEKAKAFVQAIPEALQPLGGVASGDMVLGKSKVFAKQVVMIRLDRARDMAVSTYAIDIQRFARGHRTRKMLSTCKVVFDQLKSWCAANDFYKSPGRQQEVFARAKDLEIMDMPEVTALQSRLKKLAQQVPLVKAIKTALDEEDLEKLQEDKLRTFCSSQSVVETLQIPTGIETLRLRDCNLAQPRDDAEDGMPMSKIWLLFGVGSILGALLYLHVPGGSSEQTTSPELDRGPTETIDLGETELWEDSCVASTFPRPRPLVRSSSSLKQVEVTFLNMPERIIEHKTPPKCRDEDDWMADKIGRPIASPTSVLLWRAVKVGHPHNGLLDPKKPMPEQTRSCMKAVPKILHFLWFCSPVPEHVVKRIVDFATMNPTYKVMILVDVPPNQSEVDLMNVPEVTRRPAGGIVVPRT
eukprot:symbB.v1.2.020004.t2/scaffold1659.1/size107071/6